MSWKPFIGSGSASASATTGLSTFSENARTSYWSFFCSSDIVKLIVMATFRFLGCGVPATATERE